MANRYVLLQNKSKVQIAAGLTSYLFARIFVRAEDGTTLVDEVINSGGRVSTEYIELATFSDGLLQVQFNQQVFEGGIKHALNVAGTNDPSGAGGNWLGTRYFYPKPAYFRWDPTITKGKEVSVVKQGGIYKAKYVRANNFNQFIDNLVGNIEFGTGKEVSLPGTWYVELGEPMEAINVNRPIRALNTYLVPLDPDMRQPADEVRTGEPITATLMNNLRYCVNTFSVGVFFE